MSDTTARAEAVSRLEEEGEIGADYLEELLDIADIGGDIDIDIDHGRASVAVVASDEGDEHELADLVGDEGEVLEAVQDLTRLAVQARTGSRSRLMLDINGYRASRRHELTKVAEEAITKVLLVGEPVVLEPMNPFERKICHDVVAAAGLASESEGAEPYRHVVVSPAKDDVSTPGTHGSATAAGTRTEDIGNGAAFGADSVSVDVHASHKLVDGTGHHSVAGIGS
ncbi:protein jag [Actinomyces wuliandei]|uniref:Jag family protein n=1 Tax=Actinomyces wuliandei TaxID=2057743 RepID=UPI000FD7B8E8|nr:R3H domain-containing nucleic acid-binding protein [Actinomyces wuliandei]